VEKTELNAFVNKLGQATDAAKLSKAMSMLRADRFQLFVDSSDTEVVGVVKSQGDPSLIYACRLSVSGQYSCCTQNLNACGGLRGSVCKHILVLTVGLVQSDQMHDQLAVAWIGRSKARKPELDRDAASEVFIRYKGAEAGQIDWRPTETLPEDFYAL
jgi:hypothetical protein